MLMTLSTKDLMEAIGKPGEDGDANQILKIVNHIIIGCKDAIEWERQIKYTCFPNEFKFINKELQEITKKFIDGIEKIPKDLSDIFSVKSPEGKFKTRITFDLPESYHKIITKIQKKL